MESPLPTSDLSRFQLAQRIIQALGIRRALAISRVEQIIEVLGADQALTFLDETLRVELHGGEQQGDDLRRKMPGGIFFTFGQGFRNVRSTLQCACGLFERGSPSCSPLSPEL